MLTANITTALRKRHHHDPGPLPALPFHDAGSVGPITASDPILPFLLHHNLITLGLLLLILARLLKTVIPVHLRLLLVVYPGPLPLVRDIVDWTLGFGFDFAEGDGAFFAFDALCHK